MDDVVLLYVTCADATEARRIAAALLEDRLIACANVAAPHTAIYRWQGEVREEQETHMFLKTRAALADRVVERIKAMHSYTCPGIVVLPIQGGHEPFLRWIADETAGQR